MIEPHRSRLVDGPKAGANRWRIDWHDVGVKAAVLGMATIIGVALSLAVARVMGWVG